MKWLPVFLILIGFSAGLAVVWFPKHTTTNEIYLESQAGCDLSESGCFAGENSQIKLELNPRPVPLLKPIVIKALISDTPDLRTVQLAVEGINMFMGIQVIPLIPSAEDAEIWSGELVLPVCSSREMTWKADLTLLTTTKKIRSSFQFSTTSP